MKRYPYEFEPIDEFSPHVGDDPETWTTFRYEDPGFLVGAEFAFTTDPEFFGDEDEPVSVVVEEWVLVRRRVVSSKEVS